LPAEQLTHISVIFDDQNFHRECRFSSPTAMTIGDIPPPGELDQINYAAPRDAVSSKLTFVR
jgi:hypothetical protein